MASLGLIRWRCLGVVVPFVLFGCFTAGDDAGDENDDGESKGCRADSECRLGRVCIDKTGDRDDFCEDGEDCACGEPPGGTGGTSNGGSSSGSGGSATGGSATGGSATGGSATGGSATGGSATGGSATGGSSGTGGDCGSYCDRLVGAMCAAVTEAACLTDCNELVADCPTEAAALNVCVANPANPVSCQAGQTVIDGCDAQIDGVSRCFVCVPQTTDTTCGTCSKTSCCDEFGDFNLAPDVDAFYTCATACTTADCFDACVLANPVAGMAYSALAECQDDSCAEPCICGASSSDDTCSTCYKSSCCSEFAAYSLAPNAVDFENCAIDCADELCFAECADQFPEAAAAYDTWAGCIDSNCADECAL